MADIAVVFQGITNNTHLNKVREMLSIDEIDRAILSSAFINEAGISVLSDLIEKNCNVTQIFAGVRNDITSYQGMKLAFDLVGDKLYAVDTGSLREIFHQKVYYAQGKGRAKLIIGSANLTLGGLNNNIEASAIIGLSSEYECDGSVADHIIEYFDGAIIEFPENIIQISSAEVLLEMLKNGQLIDEDVIVPPRSNATKQGGTNGDVVPRIELKVPRIYKQKKKIGPSEAKPEPEADLIAPVIVSERNAKYDLIWETSNLKRRDLNIPTEASTNRTGSINLDQGDMDEEVDFQRYFRHIAFDRLDWPAVSGVVDDAQAVFDVIIKGIDYGTHIHTIAHTTSTTSPSFLQNNAMTRLRWGPIRDFVSREDLLGHSLRIYRNSENGRTFILEID